MTNATDYRNQAAACRKASSLGRRPALYLLNLAEHYDRQAARLDARFRLGQAGAGGTRDTDGDTDKEEPRR